MTYEDLNVVPKCKLELDLYFTYNIEIHTTHTQLLPEVGYSQVKMSKTSDSPVQTVGVETGLSVIPSSSGYLWM